MPDVPQWLTSFLSPPLPVGTSNFQLWGLLKYPAAIISPTHCSRTRLRRSNFNVASGQIEEVLISPSFLEPKCLVKAASCGYKLPLASAKALSSTDPPLPPTHPIQLYAASSEGCGSAIRRCRDRWNERSSKKVRSRIQIIVCIFPLDPIIPDICCRSWLHAVT